MKSLDLDSQPVLGNWVIKATVMGFTKRTEVKVDEYGIYVLLFNTIEISVSGLVHS